MSPLHTWHPKSSGFSLPLVLCPVYFFHLEQAKPWDSTGKWTLTCCPRSSFSVCPTFQQTDTCLLLQRGNAPWSSRLASRIPGSLSWLFLTLSLSFLSVWLHLPTQVQYLPHRAVVRPFSGRWGRKTHHSWISSSAFPNSVLTLLCWQKIKIFIHSFHLMLKFGAFISTSLRQGWVWDVEEIRYRNFCSYSWNTWNFRHNWGQRSFVPLSQATSNHQITFCNANPAFGLQNSLRNGASAHLVCVRDASAFCDTVQTVLQHGRNNPGNVCWLLFKRMCREKSF